MMTDKHSLREMLRQRRKQAHPPTPAQIADLNQTLLNVTQPLNAQTIAGYYPMTGEADPRLFLLQKHQEGCTIYLPRMTESTTYFARFTENTPLEKSPFGMMQPTAAAEPLSVEDAKQAIDLWIVPGLGFTPSGQRIGLGKGFYDRFLQGATGTKIGLAFEWQCLGQEIAADPWDVAMDQIVRG